MTTPPPNESSIGDSKLIAVEETQNQRSTRSRSQRRTSAISKGTQFLQTPTSSRPGLPPHPHSEPSSLPSQQQFHGSVGSLELPKTRNATKSTSVSVSPSATKKEKSSSGTNVSAFVSDDRVANYPSQKRVFSRDGSAPGTPSPPPRLQLERPTRPRRMARPQSGEEGTPLGETGGPHLSREHSAGGSIADEGSSDSDASMCLESPEPPSPSRGKLSESVDRLIRFEKTHPEDLTPRVKAGKVFDAMRKKAMAIKEASRGEYGCIYILEASNRPGYVKIGRTVKDPENRRQKVQRCGVQLELVSDQHFTKLPCHERLEAIIHADLWNERHYFRCPCRKPGTKSKESNHRSDGFTKHGEWFKIDKSEAMQRVEKWRDWMGRDPYDLHGVLKSNWLKRIDTFERNKDYWKIVNHEHDTSSWWLSFMEPFPNPSWIRKATIEPRIDENGIQGPSRMRNIWKNRKDLVYFCVLQLLLSGFLLEIATKQFSGPGFCVFAHLSLASTSICWF